MNSFKQLGIAPGKAICYSGYRHGQNPGTEDYPTKKQISEDLKILEKRWKYLRLYDCTTHAVRTLEVIRDNKMPLKVMIGADIGAEVNNPKCPWAKHYEEAELQQNRKNNLEKINRLTEMANAYPEIVFSLSVGNEATVEWTDHLVPVEKVIQYAKMVKSRSKQPVTFCENYVPWQTKLEGLANELDFLSVHTYPVWEHQPIQDALEYTKANYRAVAQRYPNKAIVITEAGWTTNSNGQGIPPHNVNEELQEIYYHDLEDWCAREGILTFLFEAFDEPWKGSADELEPEKHWGIFTVDRKPKKVMRPFYPELV